MSGGDKKALRCIVVIIVYSRGLASRICGRRFKFLKDKPKWKPGSLAVNMGDYRTAERFIGEFIKNQKQDHDWENDWRK